MDDSSLPNGFLDIPKLSVLKNKETNADKIKETERNVDTKEFICFRNDLKIIIGTLIFLQLKDHWKAIKNHRYITKNT